MNAIRQTQQLNKRELENAIPPSASWHADYRDTAWIYIGGLPLDLSEGDVLIIFSQFGNPTHLNLIRDRDTGKSKGFGFLKYEDQRSCDLAVDNLTGAEVLGRMLRVDHSRYKKKEGEDEETYRIERLEAEAEAEENARSGKRTSDTEESDGERHRRKRRRAVRDREHRLAIRDKADDDDEEKDPMAEYLTKDRDHRRHDRQDHHRSSRHRRRRPEDQGDRPDSSRGQRHRRSSFSSSSEREHTRRNYSRDKDGSRHRSTR